MKIVAKSEISAADESAIRTGLRTHNREKSGFTGPHGELVLCLTGDDGVTLGGLTARYGYQWMFIELLFIPESARGQQLGTQMMAQAERVARDNGLTGIWLDTFAFQARGFYEKLGYTIFGTLEGHPRDGRRFFLEKRFDASPTAN